MNLPDLEVVTPEEVARRISESSGVHVTGRTVWEKARRIGIAKKMGRTPLIAVSDIPLLLREEDKKAQAKDWVDEVRAEQSMKKVRSLLKKERQARLAAMRAVEGLK